MFFDGKESTLSSFPDAKTASSTTADLMFLKASVLFELQEIRKKINKRILKFFILTWF